MHFVASLFLGTGLDVVRIFFHSPFNQHGIAEFVRRESCALERLVRALQRAFGGEGTQQLVMARARLVGARQDCVHDAQSRSGADPLICDILAGANRTPLRG